MSKFTRQEILSRLKEKIKKGQPIIMGGAGIGLVAKVADRAGIDILMAYNTGPFRMDGHGSLAGYLAYGDSNAITLQLGNQILPVVEKTPVIGGIGAADPYRDIDQLIDQMTEMGFTGITNVPTAGLYEGRFRRHIDATGIKRRAADALAVALCLAHSLPLKTSLQEALLKESRGERPRSARWTEKDLGGFR